ncbi:MAG: hypothetical protein IT168_15150 [Bryobacterales bacterium]|nr:hypothetical protein [Bryobacterales bacterium]
MLLAGVSLAIAVLGTGVMSWDDLGTGEGRINMVASSIAFLQSDPFVLLSGGGTLNYMVQFSQVQVVHNFFAYLILQFGIIVAVAWLVLITTAQVKTFRQLAKMSGDEQVLGLALWAGVFTTVYVYGQSASILDMVQAGMWILFLQALALHLRPDREPRSAFLRNMSRARAHSYVGTHC